MLTDIKSPSVPSGINNTEANSLQKANIELKNCKNVISMTDYTLTLHYACLQSHQSLSASCNVIPSHRSHLMVEKALCLRFAVKN